MPALKTNFFFKGTLFIAALGALIYSNTFLNSFHFDDFPSIVNNASIRSFHELYHVWGSEPTRFVTFFSFALNYHWGGLNVCGYHIINLLIHVATSILVWRFMLLTPGSSPGVAFFTALIFLTHPLQTQAVNYIYQRAVLLAAFFYMASLGLYIKANRAWESKISSPEGKFYYGGSLICALLSLLSKENAVSLPLMICLYQGLFFKEQNGFHWKKVIPFFLAILAIPLAWGVLNAQTLMGIKNTVEGLTSQGLTVQQYSMTQVKVILTYLKLLVLPLHQRVEYDYTAVSSFFDVSVLGSAFLLLLIIGIAVALRNRFRLLSFGIFWFFITLMPESSFWPNRDLIYEHRVYLPLVGFACFLSSGLFYIFRGQRASLTIKILTIFVIAYSLLTFQRNKVWRDEFTLWDDAVHQSPQSSRAYLNRGAAYQAAGDLDHAMQDYNMAIGLGPVETTILSNRGLIFLKKGKLDLALANFDLAIKINPSFVGTYVNRGKLYQMQGKLDQARQDLDRAIELAPNNVGGYVARGMFEADIGDLRGAISDYNTALMIQPDNPVIYGDRAAVYYAQKDYSRSWQDVHKVESLGSGIKTQYLQALEKASGREQ